MDTAIDSSKSQLLIIESMLFSGNPVIIAQGLELAKEHQFDLSALFSDINRVAGLMGWSITEPALLFYNLSQVEHLVVFLGKNPEEYPLAFEVDALLPLSNFEELPSEWPQLFVRLQRLVLVGGQFEQLPNSLCDFPQLTALSLWDVNFEQFPVGIRRLKALESIHIWHNVALFNTESLGFALPIELSSLKALRTLIIESCQLTFIPEQIQFLEQLSHLQLNCDAESLCQNRKTYLDFKQKKGGFKLHFIPETIGQLSNLKELCLLLPAGHFPLKTSLFKNEHLRSITISARLLPQFPIYSPELQRIENLELFKPSLLQHLRLIFALPDCELVIRKHPFSRSLLGYNILLLLLWWPAGAWFFAFELLAKQCLVWLKKENVLILRWTFALLFYPLAFLTFLISTLIYSFISFFPKRLQND